MVPGGGFPRVVPRPTAASPGGLSEMQVLGPRPRPTGDRAQLPMFSEAPQVTRVEGPLVWGPSLTCDTWKRTVCRGEEAGLPPGRPMGGAGSRKRRKHRQPGGALPGVLGRPWRRTTRGQQRPAVGRLTPPEAGILRARCRTPASSRGSEGESAPGPPTRPALGAAVNLGHPPLIAASPQPLPSASSDVLLESYSRKATRPNFPLF